MEPTELEREIDRALRSLPAPRAPRTLAPRVMQAVAASARTVAAARIGWRRWPAGAQMLALVVACTIAAAIVIAVPLASNWIGDSAAARAVMVLWRTFFEPIVPAAIAVVAVMCMATALLIAGLKHVALENQWTPHA